MQRKCIRNSMLLEGSRIQDTWGMERRYGSKLILDHSMLPSTFFSHFDGGNTRNMLSAILELQ